MGAVPCPWDTGQRTTQPDAAGLTTPNMGTRFHDRSNDRRESHLRSIECGCPEAQASVLRYARAAKQILAQFTLISEDMVIAEFRFDSSTRPTFTHVMSACGMDAAKYAP